MKKIIILLSFVCASNLVFAQWGCPPPNPYEFARQMQAIYNQSFQSIWQNSNANMPASPWIYPAPVNGTNDYPSNSTESNQRNYTREKKTCGLCHGTGRYYKSDAVDFGYRKWCDECGKEVSGGHYHTTCPSCKGAGKW